MAIRIPKSPVAAKSALVSVGTVIATAGGYLQLYPVLPPNLAWVPLALVFVGGLLGGKALLQRPGDVKAVP
jgi:hypothetical protein